MRKYDVRMKIKIADEINTTYHRDHQGNINVWKQGCENQIKKK